MNPDPGPLSILLLDNCNIHRAEEICALVEDDAREFLLVHVLIFYLNFYDRMQACFSTAIFAWLQSYWASFSAIKAFLRRSWDDFSLSVIDHACHSIMASKAWGFFRSSGYV